MKKNEYFPHPNILQYVHYVFVPSVPHFLAGLAADGSQYSARFTMLLEFVVVASEGRIS